MDSAPSVLAYHTGRRRFPGAFHHYFLWLAYLFISYGLLGNFLFAFVIFAVPQLRQVYLDHRITLPRADNIIMYLAFPFIYQWGWAVALAFVCILPLPMSILSTRVEPEAHRKRFIRLIRLCPLLAILLFILVATLAMAIPYYRLLASPLPRP